MNISSDYEMTFPYGVTDPPYGTPAFPYHRGDDWYMPEGTPVVVNGVEIGVSGQTGWVSGPHCHVGRWVNGTDTNPQSGGWDLDNPHVTDIGYDSVNGNYVGLLDAQGVRWVYLHMRDKSQQVKVGDYLKDLPKYQIREDVMDEKDVKSGYLGLLHRSPENDDSWRHWLGKKPSDFNEQTVGSAEWLTQNDVLLRAYPALQAQVASLQKELASNGSDQALQIVKDMQAVIDKYKAR